MAKSLSFYWTLELCFSIVNYSSESIKSSGTTKTGISALKALSNSFCLVSLAFFIIYYCYYNYACNYLFSLFYWLIYCYSTLNYSN